MRGERELYIPLLDFVEALEEGYGDEDHDCFFAVADFELERELLAGVGFLSYRRSILK